MDTLWTTPANLNRLGINTDGAPDDQQDYSVISDDGQTEVVLRNLSHRLIRLIRQYPAAVGCVAWLTHFDILDVLATRKSVSLVVQKEDFLRPDMGAPSGWKDLLRRKYNALPEGARLEHRECVVGELSYCSDPTLDGVRCVGNYNTDKNPAFPRAHHKFLVLGRVEGEMHDVERQAFSYGIFKPEVVWTGSFNLTQNATNSFENAVILRDPKLVNAFYQEWGQIVALSEPLDWTSDWVAPEFRIGS
jgi:hypothetical protein